MNKNIQYVAIAGIGKGESTACTIAHILANTPAPILIISSEDKSMHDIAMSIQETPFAQPIIIEPYPLRTLEYDRPIIPKQNHKRKSAGPYNKPRRRNKR